MGKIDLTGKKFGKLTVVEMLYNYNGTGRTHCRCTCDCGTENVIRNSYQLKHATDSSCGCGKKEYIRKSCGKEIDGMRFGRLTVLETLWEDSPVRVKCLCDCGNVSYHIKVDVMSGHTLSCGCLQRERAGESNMVDHTGEVSTYGVQILNRTVQNKKGQWLWNCKCGYCGNTFEELPARVLNNHVRSCGCLITSSRELLIKKLLDESGVEYVSQYTFNDLIGLSTYRRYPLRFDFAVFNNGDLSCLIEYDGEQHFNSISFYGGDEALLRSQLRDQLKDEYCAQNGYKLYRIHIQQQIMK